MIYLDYAVDKGVNFIDTAEMYPVPPMEPTQGDTEVFIGDWLAKRGKRDDLVLATKIAGPAEWLSYIRGGSRLTEAHITQAIDDSLSRLQTDYIDLYQLHWPDRNTNYFGELDYNHNPDEESTPIEETLKALEKAVASGKIRQIGLSNETPWGVMSFLKHAELAGLPKIQSIQNPYNLLNRTYEVGLSEISMREQVGLLAYSPLAFGVLTGKYLDGNKPENARLTRFERFTRYANFQAEEATAEYVKLARNHGISPAQMALAYVNQRPFLTSTIIGATTMNQLQENISSIDVVLPDEVLSGIESIHSENSNPCP